MSVTSFVGLDRVPETVRALDTLDRVDYVDVYATPVDNATARTPEEWARVVMEQTPIGKRAPMLWRALGLRLGPPGSADHIQGWRIADRGDDWIRVETSSWFATAHAICRVTEHEVSVGLFLRYDSPLAALIWPPVALGHQRGLPAMLRQAVRR